MQRCILYLHYNILVDLPKSSHPDAHRTLTIRHGASLGKRDSREDRILPTHQPSYSKNIHRHLHNESENKSYENNVSKYILH